MTKTSDELRARVVATVRESESKRDDLMASYPIGTVLIGPAGPMTVTRHIGREIEVKGAEETASESIETIEELVQSGVLRRA